MCEINLVTFTDQIVDNIVTEIDVETRDEDNAFDVFINRNADHISDVVSEYQ